MKCKNCKKRIKYDLDGFCSSSCKESYEKKILDSYITIDNWYDPLVEIDDEDYKKIIRLSTSLTNRYNLIPYPEKFKGYDCSRCHFYRECDQDNCKLQKFVDEVYKIIKKYDT